MDSVITFCAKYLIFFIGLIVLYTWYKTKRRREFMVAVGLAIIFALILTKIAGSLYFHPRPFVAQHIKPLIPHGADNGFPSEHTVAAVTLATAVFFYRKKFAAWAFGLAVAVGISRMLAHVHSLIDIIGGLAIGAAAGYLGLKGARYLVALSAKQRAGRR